MTPEYGAASQLEKVDMLDFADFVERLDSSDWAGPVESFAGIHLVRIVDRHSPEVASYEQVESYLRQEWAMTTPERAS